MMSLCMTWHPVVFERFVIQQFRRSYFEYLWNNRLTHAVYIPTYAYKNAQKATL